MLKLAPMTTAIWTLLTVISVQTTQVDQAMELILTRSQIGRAICTRILGGDPSLIETHAGVSTEAAKMIARNCSDPGGIPFVARGRSSLRKTTLSGETKRRYQFYLQPKSPLIESWTDPYSHTTYILTSQIDPPFEELVQILAHELAIYFDSKSSPERAYSTLAETGNPQFPIRASLAASDPLIAPAFGFLRAAQIEKLIIDDLLKQDLVRSYFLKESAALNAVLRPLCRRECIVRFLEYSRDLFKPLALPFLAFSPVFRSQTLELLTQQKSRDFSFWNRTHFIMETLPQNYLDDLKADDFASQIGGWLNQNERFIQTSAQVANFLDDELWPIERAVLENSRVPQLDMYFVEYLKIPKLSSDHIEQASGPRVRVRTGGTD